MRRTHTTVRLAVIIAALLALAAPVFAQSPPTDLPPTKDDPIRFSSFAVQMQGGITANVLITLERWSTDAERNAIIEMVKTMTGRQDQQKLVTALQKIKPRVGFIRTANSRSWDLQYAWEHRLEDGSRQLVIATDKPVSFWAAANSARTLDYAFTLIEMRFPPNSKEGEGKILGQTSIIVKNGRLELEIFNQEPMRLMTITQQKRKGQK